MDTKYLKSFLIAADSHSFSKAENKLFLSKQGLKRQIDVLEQDLNVKLFNRTQHGIFLTSIGKVFYDYAQSAVKAEEKMLAELSTLDQRKNSIIILNHPNQRTWLERVYSEFNIQYPNIRLILNYIIPSPSNGHKQNFTDEIIEKVTDGSADVALHVLYQGDVIPPNLSYLKVISQTAHCLMMPSHPLANEKKISLEQLSSYHIAFTQRRQDSAFANLLKEACPNHEICEVSLNNVPQIFSTCYNSGIWVTKAYYSGYLPPLVAVPLDLECNSFSGLLYRRKHFSSVDKFVKMAKDIYLSAISAHA